MKLAQLKLKNEHKNNTKKFEKVKTKGEIHILLSALHQIEINLSLEGEYRK